MEKEKESKKNDKKLIVVISLLFFLLALYMIIIIYNFFEIENYKKKVFPNSYLEEFEISEYKYDELNRQIDIFNETIGKFEIVVLCNGKEYKYTYGDLGISLDGDKIKENISKHQHEMSYSDKLLSLYSDTKKIYNYEFKYDDVKIKEFLNNLKPQVDMALVNGYFDVGNGSVKYITGNDSFSLDVDASYIAVVNSIDKGLNNSSKIELVGTSQKAVYNQNYSTIDTKVSSFSTEFNKYQYARVTNLKTALNYINGAIVEPGEVFSFYKYAGPYNKNGYVFYYEFVGNGVCQIATTVYNAALLGGLEIVQRYPHAAKSVYVKGGLDATVASYASGWHVDFKFRNTYKYPIYISAYMVDNKAYVEFWSDKNATEGKTYATESIQIGYRGYTTYLYTYQNGVQIDKKKIATTWYTED